MSTEKSEEANKYFISEELLDVLVLEYMKASGNMHRSQEELLKYDPEVIKNDMLAAHGMGHLLLNIMSRIPEGLINGNSNREFVWFALTGTDRSRNRSQRETGEGPTFSGGSFKGKGKRKSIWRR